MITTLTWHEAREVLPEKDCEVLAISITPLGMVNLMHRLSYEDGHFNGKTYSMDDSVRYWALVPKAQEIGDAIKEEDDF